MEERKIVKKSKLIFFYDKPILYYWIKKPNSFLKSDSSRPGTDSKNSYQKDCNTKVVLPASIKQRESIQLWMSFYFGASGLGEITKTSLLSELRLLHQRPQFWYILISLGSSNRRRCSGFFYQNIWFWDKRCKSLLSKLKPIYCLLRECILLQGIRVWDNCWLHKILFDKGLLSVPALIFEINN